MVVTFRSVGAFPRGQRKVETKEANANELYCGQNKSKIKKATRLDVPQPRILPLSSRLSTEEGTCLFYSLASIRPNRLWRFRWEKEKITLREERTSLSLSRLPFLSTRDRNDRLLLTCIPLSLNMPAAHARYIQYVYIYIYIYTHTHIYMYI